MHVPDLRIAHHERVFRVGADAVDTLAQVDPVQSVGVGLVVLEAHERQRADVGGLARAVGLHDRKGRLERTAGRRLEAVAVAVVFAADVAREGVEAVGPPEPGAFVGVEGQGLLGQRLAAERLHREVAVEDVVDLGAVFEEEAVADALVADAIADHEVVGAVDRHPAVAAVPDRRADHGAAAHRVAGEVIVDRVFAENAFLAQVPKLGVADRATRVSVVHGVAACDGGVGGFDDDIAAQVRHLAAVVATAWMVEFDRFIDRHGRAVDGANDALFRCQPWFALGFARPSRIRYLAGAFRAGDDDAVADPPAGDCVAQCHRLVTILGVGAELDPGATQGRAVQVHASSAADNCRARFLVQAVAPGEPDFRGVFGVERLLGGADFEGGFGQVGVHVRQVGVAVEAVFGGVVARLNL